MAILGRGSMRDKNKVSFFHPSNKYLPLPSFSAFLFFFFQFLCYFFSCFGLLWARWTAALFHHSFQYLIAAPSTYHSLWVKTSFSAIWWGFCPAFLLVVILQLSKILFGYFFFCFDSFRIGKALKHCEWFFRHLWRCWWWLMILGDWLQVSFNSLRFLQITLTTCSRFLGLPLTLISILRDCWSFHCRFFVIIFCGSPFALNRQTQQSNALWVEIDLNSSTNLQRIVKEFPRRREAVALNCQTRQ